MPEPTLCWCWNEGARTTAPSIRLIREIIDGAGIEINGYQWARVRRISEGHPDAATDVALESIYVARWQARNAVAPDIRANFADMEVYRKEALQSWFSGGIMKYAATHEIPAGALVSPSKETRICVAPVESIEQPKPSALSRIWAILRGGG